MSSDSENIINLYQRFAVEWDRERCRTLFEKPWLDRLLSLLPPEPSILDMGCGGGEPVARYLIENGCDLTGIDSSPVLIGMCEERFPGREWIATDMRTLSLNRRFDGVLAWDSFFHLCPDDQRRMFPIFRKHAAPNAALLFTSGPSYGDSISTYQGEPLYHGSLDEIEYRSLLDQNGFSIVSHVVEDPDCGNHTVWLAQLR